MTWVLLLQEIILIRSRPYLSRRNIGDLLCLSTIEWALLDIARCARLAMLSQLPFIIGHIHRRLVCFLWNSWPFHDSNLFLTTVEFNMMSR